MFFETSNNSSWLNFFAIFYVPHLKKWQRSVEKDFRNEIDRFMSFINCVDVYFFPESQMSHFLFELDQTSFFQILFIPPNDLCQNVEKVHSTTYLNF